MTSGQHAPMDQTVTEHFDGYSGSMLRRLALSCLVLCVAGVSHAEESFAQDPAQDLLQETVHESAPETTQAAVFNLEGVSDQQIGLLLQRWPQLDATQRRDLLAEVRKRMRLASQEQQAQDASAVRNKTPSLTVRIKRAQTRHGYGRPAPRAEAAGNNAQPASAEGAQQNPQRPRELVIRTTVTQVLPDGSRITRQETLVPSSLRAKVARQEQSSGASPVNSVAQDSQNTPSGKVRVRRTTVRFGTGFHQRHQQADSATALESGMRTISKSDGLAAPTEVLISVPVPTIAPEAN